MLAALASSAAGRSAQGWRDDPIPPRHVTIRPVFFVPSGVPGPTSAQREQLRRHLVLARSRYTELLGGRDSFELDTVAAVVQGLGPLSLYRGGAEDGVPQITAELLDRFQVSRFGCPSVFVVVVMNPGDDYPNGGGRPLNGGLNTGGGVVALSSFALDRIPWFQSTLRHELGHAFGLPHADGYGRDMRTDPSLMSYNPAHHTDGFRDAATPGVLVAEDVRALALNRRVFASLVFDHVRDRTAGRSLAPDIVTLGPMTIPGHPDARITVSTRSGAAYGSRAANVVQGEIRPSAGPGVTFDASRMWHSDSSAYGWVDLELTFPVAVTLTRIAVFTQHSGLYHAARRVRISLGDGGRESRVAEADLSGPDAEVPFAAARGRRWRVDLQSGESGQVVVRGLRFFSGEDEVFPPSVPGAR